MWHRCDLCLGSVASSAKELTCLSRRQWRNSLRLNLCNPANWSVPGHLNTWDDMRNAVIDEITVRGRANPPQIVVDLIRSFLQGLPLPRLLHFVDLVLPQMVPVSSPSQSTKVTVPGSQLIRDQWIAKAEGRPDQAANILVVYPPLQITCWDWTPRPIGMDTLSSCLLTWMLMSMPLFGSTNLRRQLYYAATERYNGSQEGEHGASSLHLSWSSVPGHSHDVRVYSRQQRRRYSTQVMETCAAPPDGVCVVASRPCGSLLPSCPAARPKQAVWRACQLCCPTDVESHHHSGPTILYRR